MPFGDTSSVKILAKKDQALSKKTAEALIAKHRGFKLKSFKKTTVKKRQA
ncbi:MAG: hypothetical protein V3W41_09230 [Planctomycetota bacterium]